VSTTDKANNKGQEAKGAVQEKAGQITGDKDLQAKGKGNKAASDIKQAGEKVKDALKR
jgi:uncharacterized protein YjbJ (UPF0337 family)